MTPKTTTAFGTDRDGGVLLGVGRLRTALAFGGFDEPEPEPEKADRPRRPPKKNRNSRRAKVLLEILPPYKKGTTLSSAEIRYRMLLAARHGEGPDAPGCTRSMLRKMAHTSRVRADEIIERLEEEGRLVERITGDIPGQRGKPRRAFLFIEAPDAKDTGSSDS